MAGGGGVEDDVVVICWGGEEFGELVKGGDFDGAGAGELFLHAGEGGGREDAAVGADDAFAIGEGGGFGIDVAGFQLGQAGDGGGGVGEGCGEDFVEVGGGVCGDEEDSLALIGEGDGGGAGEGCFADATFAGEEEDAGWVG